MSDLNPDAWDLLVHNHFLEARKKHPDMDLGELHRRVRRAVTEQYGPRPSRGGEKPPWKVRLALWAVKRKIEEVPMSPLVKKLVVSAVYAVGAAWPTYQAVSPGGMNADELGLVVGSFVAAFWGTFKSNTTVLAPSRPGESVTSTGPGMNR